MVLSRYTSNARASTDGFPMPRPIGAYAHQLIFFKYRPILNLLLIGFAFQLYRHLLQGIVAKLTLRITYLLFIWTIIMPYWWPLPADMSLNFVNDADIHDTQIHDVIGTIHGVLCNEVVIVGNHRDAWGPGV